MKIILPFVVIGILVLSGLGAVNAFESENEQYKQALISFSKPIINEQENYLTIDFSESTSNSMKWACLDMI